MAGVSAAEVLSEAGVKHVTLIEGSNRVGGRVKSINFEGFVVEEGATFIQGLINNPLWNEAQHDLLEGYIQDFDNYIVLDSNGKDITIDFDIAYQNSEKAMEYVASLHNGKFDMSIRSALTSAQMYPKSIAQDMNEIYEYDWDYGIEPTIPSVKHGKPDKISAADEREFYVTDQRGYEIVPQLMLNRTMQKVKTTKLHLEKIVASITHRETKIIIKTSENETFTADYVISTLPLGVLQHRAVEFIPELLEWKLNAIDKHKMTPLTLIYIKYSATFWNDTEIILHASNIRGYYPIFINLDATKAYATDTHMLVVHIMGNQAERVSRLSVETIKTELTEVLRGMYGPSVPEPDSISVSPWVNNPLSRGSQSTWPAGMTDDDFARFNAPLNRLYFAGEAHSRSLGYVRGAYYSGRNTAKALIKCMRLYSDCERYIS